LLMDNIVIKPYQEELCAALDEILAVNGISLKLYFKTIQPLEFTDLENTTTEEQVAEETGLSSHTCLSKDFTDEEGEALFDSLAGETIDDEWELVDKREYSDSNVSIEEWANSKIKTKQTLFEKLADVIKSNPSAKSTLDKKTFKVRYEYAEKYSSGNSRAFCRRMMGRTANGVVYRKEDIDQASFIGVNNSFGHKGQNYSLFKFKGGVNCGHVWNENLYRLKTKTDGTPYVDKSLSSSEEVSSIAGYNPNPAGWSEAQIAPIDMPNNGHHPNYNK
jgi:hypothetical protein